MHLKKITTQAEAEIAAAALDDIVSSLAIPPQPAVVQQMQTEMGKPEPDVRKAAQIVSQDIGLTVAVLKAVNSPLFGLSRKVESVDAAVNMIGMRALSNLVTAVSLRTTLVGEADSLAHFFDMSSKRAFALARLARELPGVDAPHAQTFGLFCDVAIPLLLRRFPNYRDTLQQAETDPTHSFTEIEHQAHHTDHALIGALVAKTWGLPKNVCLAIRLHHDYKIFLDAKVPREICTLIALGLIADAAIKRYAGNHPSTEWGKGGDFVAGALVLSPDEIEEWVVQLHADFAAGIE
jgi:HD-like signal output (HDOD) protein